MALVLGCPELFNIDLAERVLAAISVPGQHNQVDATHCVIGWAVRLHTGALPSHSLGCDFNTGKRALGLGSEAHAIYRMTEAKAREALADLIRQYWIWVGDQVVRLLTEVAEGDCSLGLLQST